MKKDTQRTYKDCFVGVLLLLAFLSLTHHRLLAQSQSDSTSFDALDDLFIYPDSSAATIVPEAIAEQEVVDSILGSISYDSTLYSKKSDYWRNEFLKMITAGGGIHHPEKYLDSIRYEKASRYEDFSGRTIRNIRIRQLEIFGQEVVDTTKVPDSWIEKLGNGLHIHTQQKIIRNRLLFQPGDTIDPMTIADNERLIRNLSYIEDALILLSPVGNDAVDVLVITKDVLPIGISWEAYDVQYGRIGVWNSNLLGLGHELFYYLSYDYNRNPNYGHMLRYRVQNIGNSFVSGDISYQNTWDMEAYRLSLNRDFITPNSKYAGGLGVASIDRNRDVLLIDSTLQNVSLRYNYQDFWLGRAVLLRRNTFSESRTNLAVTMRLSRYLYLDRPEVSEDFLYEFHSRTIFLSSVGISKQAFLKSSLIYGFGKSEDIPYGWLLTFTGGLEINEFGNRPYVGLSWSWARPNIGFGYIMHKIEYGTFIHNGIEQGKLNASLKYISPLFNSEGRYNYRVFTELRYEGGFNRFDYEFLQLNKNNGIRGLDSPELRGNQFVSANLDGVCYSPHKILGFRFIYFAFVDFGLINHRSNTLLQNSIYTGFGAGLRLKNENLVFSTVQLRLSYYPVMPENATVEYLHLSGVSDKRFDRFVIPKPQILEYRTAD